MDRNYLDE